MRGWWARLANPFASRHNALLASEARYRELFEHVPDGLYESSPDGRILAANPALVRMLGFSSEEQLQTEGFAPDLYYDPEDRKRFAAELSRSGHLRNAEFVLRSRNGNLITVLENARAVRDSHGRLLYFQGTLTDISDRKAFERELMDARDQALEASRLKSAFIATVSHELRTPLHAVIGMSQVLLESELATETRESVSTIHHSGQLLLELINEILDFSKIEAGRVELERVAFDPRDVVYGAVQMLAGRAAAKGLYLLVDVAPETPRLVSGDPARLRQVLANLASNAVKFTEHGGVEVLLRPAGQPGTCGGFDLDVRDTGIGIAPDAREAIFQPFQQADGSTTRRYGGTGLGLAIVRQLVELMHGAIQVDSIPGKGTSFRVYLPAPDAESAPPEAPWGLGRHACLVGQCGKERSLWARWLRSWGLELTELCDGASLLAWLEGGSRADAWVLDEATLALARPQLGRSLRLLNQQESTCVALLTSPLHPRSIAPLRRAGNVVRLAKPVREDELRRALLPGSKSEPVPNPSLIALASSLAPALVRSRRILVVEDNRINQAVMRSLLGRLQFAAEFAANGREAVAAQMENPYDLILMDCQMPEHDGFGATTEIRRLLTPAAWVPIVALTAHAAETVRHTCLAAGMDDFLSKPVVLHDLARVLQRWLGATHSARPLDSASQAAV